LIASQVEGVLATQLDTDDVPVGAPYTEANGQIAIYTAGRFLWLPVRNANLGFVFDPVAINTLKAKALTFEAAYFNNRWVGAA
jgi:hypothetical protein